MKRVLSVMAVLVLALAGCGGEELAGAWYDVDFPGDRMELNSDGTGEIVVGGRLSAITWAVEDDRLCITYVADDSGWCDAFTLDGDRMTVDVGDLGFAIRYERWVGE